ATALGGRADRPVALSRIRGPRSARHRHRLFLRRRDPRISRLEDAKAANTLSFYHRTRADRRAHRHRTRLSRQATPEGFHLMTLSPDLKTWLSAEGFGDLDAT